jgi:hypothetical protein
MAATTGEVNICVLQPLLFFKQLCINGKIFAGCKIIRGASLPDNWELTVLNHAVSAKDMQIFMDLL